MLYYNSAYVIHFYCVLWYCDVLRCVSLSFPKADCSHDSDCTLESLGELLRNLGVSCLRSSNLIGLERGYMRPLVWGGCA